ncbi:MAG: aldehyde dehydrogenase [Planctomycetes bacterium]|nr:aldehyde dehydrogenase [Planctomycetota bacterium]
MDQPVHIPILRGGVEYESLDTRAVARHTDGAVLAEVSQANPGIVRRDLRRAGERARALRAVPIARLLDICRAAGEQFLRGTLPLQREGLTQSPDQYVAALSQTSGLPHALCRMNMEKVFTVLTEMPQILGGLMRGMDLALLDSGFTTHSGIDVCYGPTTDALGVVLPSNSPAVNSIWLPAIALKVPVVLKPGRDEPWTPQRLVQAFLAAGCPPEAFSIYPTDHEGAGAILEGCGRSLLFGDQSTTKAWAHDPRIQLHGPGWSKVLFGPDAIERWPEFLDLLVDSVLRNGGRSCINASTILVPSHGDAVAEALAERLAAVEPRPADSPDAQLSAFANPAFADAIDAAVESGLREPGAEDWTARHRDGPRSCTLDGGRYLRPTVVRCRALDHPLARTEFLFPFVSVVEVPAEQLVASLGRTLVVSAITRDAALIDALLQCPEVDRINLGPVPTTRVEWDQPHEGNLFEFLYQRRAIQRAESW